MYCLLLSSYFFQTQQMYKKQKGNLIPSSVSAIGFSQKTCFRASRPAWMMSKWVGVGVTTRIAWTFSSKSAYDSHHLIEIIYHESNLLCLFRMQKDCVVKTPVFLCRFPLTSICFNNIFKTDTRISNYVGQMNKSLQKF